jgi:Ca2+-binding RTX toxin-like protein
MRARQSGAVGVVALLLLLPALAAWAHQPAAHRQFMPSHFNGRADHAEHGADDNSDGDPGETSDAQIAGDLFDGIDNLFTVRAVADTQTRFYEWYECVGTRTFDPDLCRRLARDDTPTLSSPPSGVGQVAAFEAAYDIAPPTREGIHTFLALACIEETTPRGHCRGDASGVHFDNSSSTSDHPATESGQILRPIHGQAVANSGFTALGFTSQTDIGRVLFCLDIGTSPTTESGANPATGCNEGSTWDPVPDNSSVCNVQAPPNSDCWSATINPPDNMEFSLSIIEQDDPTARVSSGTGDCEEDTLVGGDGVNGGDDCQFDKIYLTSLANPPPPPPAPWPFPGEPPPELTGEGQNKCAGQTATQVGTAGDDVLVGTEGDDVILALGGNDVVKSRDGNDVVCGGPGNDRLRMGNSEKGGADMAFGQGGRDKLFGQGGRDVLRGGAKKDLIKAGSGKDRLFGQGGNDNLRGQGGSDQLNGGPGIDRCAQGAGTGPEVSCER